MINAGDEQKVHVVHDGLHYFKFGSYWLVEDDGPVAVRVYQNDLIRELEKAREKLHQVKQTEAPRLPYRVKCGHCGKGWYYDQLVSLNRSILRQEHEPLMCHNCWKTNIEELGDNPLECEDCGKEWYQDELEELTPAQAEIRKDKATHVCSYCGGSKFKQLINPDE